MQHTTYCGNEQREQQRAVAIVPVHHGAMRHTWCKLPQFVLSIWVLDLLGRTVRAIHCELSQLTVSARAVVELDRRVRRGRPRHSHVLHTEPEEMERARGVCHACDNLLDRRRGDVPVCNVQRVAARLQRDAAYNIGNIRRAPACVI